MFADLKIVSRILQPSPRHVGNMEQAVDPADINKSTVLGKILDRAFDDVADIDLVQRRGFLFVHCDVGDDLARQNDVVAASAELDDLRFDILADVTIEAADRT